MFIFIVVFICSTNIQQFFEPPTRVELIFLVSYERTSIILWGLLYPLRYNHIILICFCTRSGIVGRHKRVELLFPASQASVLAVRRMPPCCSAGWSRTTKHPIQSRAAVPICLPQNICHASESRTRCSTLKGW